MEYRENQLTYEIYFKLRESVGWDNFSEAQTRDALSHTLYNFVAFRDNEAVGMVRIVGDGLYITIVDVVVCPDYQKMGIGKGLMEKAVRKIESSTPVGGRVSIQLIAEKGKEAFYKKLGFKLIPHEYCGSGMRKVYYEKN